ncbi:unnamed protein product [Sphenostylis stenocarpa]|uniref:Uncharacterized protein n=1 Tax=Sphenostylis stenocarpa TaxID=92480 RepID=A0AA86VMP9_9FABA|nr:unnamed protein product [Sphenostylis stenocarpa]
MARFEVLADTLFYCRYKKTLDPFSHQQSHKTCLGPADWASLASSCNANSQCYEGPPNGKGLPHSPGQYSTILNPATSEFRH